jgi:hypothetical protein
MVLLFPILLSITANSAGEITGYLAIKDISQDKEAEQNLTTATSC